MSIHLQLPGPDKNTGRLPAAPTPKQPPRKPRGRARKSTTAKRFSRLLGLVFLGLCAFLAAFVLDLKNVFQMLAGVLAGEAGPLARVAAWAGLLTVGTIVFMTIRRAITGKRPARRGAKQQPPLIPDNWALILLGATAVSITGIAAWTVLLWVANILADGLVLATLAVGAMSVASIVWAIRQPTYPAPGRKPGRKRAARTPRPRPKAVDTPLRLPPPEVAEPTLPHFPPRTTVASPPTPPAPPAARPAQPGQQA